MIILPNVLAPSTPHDALPGEITDYIIDFLHSDTNSLKACAVVCRTWLPSSRFHLFSTVVCRPDKPSRTIRDLLHWASTATHVALCAMTLLVQPLSAERYSAIGIDDLEVALMVFSNVRHLILRDLVFFPQPRGHDNLLAPRSLTRLTILECMTQDFSFQPICELLHLFSDIDELSFLNVACSWRHSFASSALFVSLLTRLWVRELHVQCEDERATYTGYRGICHLFLSSQPRWRLRKLGVALPGMPQEFSPDTLLRHCQRSITDLRINVVPSVLLPTIWNVPIPSASEWDTPVLRECRSLEVLRLTFLSVADLPHVRVETAIQNAYNEVLDRNARLVSCAPPQLRTIVLTFFHFGTWDARVVGVLRSLSAWGRLDNALMALDDVKTVFCVVSRDGGADLEAQVALLRLLPETRIPDTVTDVDGERDEYVGILRSALTRVCAANRFIVLVAK